MGRWLICCIALGLGLGCVERAPELSPADRERLREHVSTDAPSPEHALEVTLDNGVELVGYDVSAESVRPGQAFTVTWYWHATQNLDDGWRLFTHVADSTGESRFNQDGEGVVREIYQPGRWQAGQYIKDEQEVTLPDDWADTEAVFFLGLWNGPHRLAVRTGPHDDENRVRALEVSVTPGPSAALRVRPTENGAAPAPSIVRPPPLTRAALSTTAQNLTIDGDVSEFSAAARPTRAFVNTMNGTPSELSATAWTLWDSENLYVAWRIEDDFVSNEHDGRDAHLWEHDAFEIMVDPTGDGRNYFEMQISPTAQLFDTRYDTRRQPQPFGHVDWNPNVEVAVNVDGTANDAGEDVGWSGEIAIPWSSFGEGIAMPERGDTWRVNFYVMDQRPGDAAQRSAGWSATHEGDFHVPARFGRVVFDAPAPEVAEAEPIDTNPSTPRLVPTSVNLNPAVAAAIRQEIEQGRGMPGGGGQPRPRR